MTPKFGARGASKMVGFRLGDALLSRLRAEAEARGVSPGTCARELVAHVLQDEARLLVLQEVEELRKDLARLRSDIATTLELLLLNLAKTDEAAVRAYVQKHLRDR